MRGWGGTVTTSPLPHCHSQRRAAAIHRDSIREARPHRTISVLGGPVTARCTKAFSH